MKSLPKSDRSIAVFRSGHPKHGHNYIFISYFIK